jgi:sulfonate transport system substrate-binding protein
MKRIIFVSLTILLAVGLITGCKGRSGKAEKTVGTVRIASFYSTLIESSAIAKSQGFFEEELAKVGFKPEYSTFAQAGPALNEALAVKAIDFGMYADFPQLVLFDKGVNVRVIAPVTTASHYGIIAGTNSGIKTPKDLEGKKVIVPKGTILQKVFEDVVEEYGLDINKIQQLNAVADQLSVYSSGEADAVVATAFTMLVLQSQSGGEIVFSTLNKPEWSTVVTVVGRGEFLDQNPDVAKALIRALYRAYEYAQGNKDGAFQALATELSPPPLIAELYSFDTSFSYFKPEFTGADIAKVDSVNTFLFEQKLIAQKVDLNKFIDRSYYEAVKAEFK